MQFKYLLTAALISAKTVPITVYSHMVNNLKAVQIGLRFGANALEMDLQFENNEPIKWMHGGSVSDCTCFVGGPCTVLNKDTSTEALQHLQDIAALENFENIISIFVDSKLDPKGANNLELAGTNVINLMEKFYELGYQGQIVIAAPKITHYSYLEAALRQARTTNHADKYFFTVYGEGSKTTEISSKLAELGTPNVGFWTGSSACFPNFNYQTITSGRYNFDNDSVAAVGIWTVDVQENMEKYLDVGATSITTNHPARAIKAINAKGLEVAKMGEAFFPANEANLPITISCKCAYQKNGRNTGCVITEPAPVNRACKCVHGGPRVCNSQVTKCSLEDDEFCKNPDTSKSSCELGDGDCGGYKRKNEDDEYAQ